MTTGLRTEELRALRWSEVDLDAGTVAVYRAVRATADTKTPKSRRVLSLPQLAVRALREHLDRQAGDRLLAGVLWEDHGLVFASAVGTPLDRHNVLREFRKITQAAGLGTDWVPREMRHTFVSLLSSNGTALEDIANLVGHRGTTTTETVYRKVIVPELRRGAEVMDRSLSDGSQPRMRARFRPGGKLWVPSHSDVDGEGCRLKVVPRERVGLCPRRCPCAVPERAHRL